MGILYLSFLRTSPFRNSNMSQMGLDVVVGQPKSQDIDLGGNWGVCSLKPVVRVGPSLPSAGRGEVSHAGQDQLSCCSVQQGRDMVSHPRASEEWACSAWLSGFNITMLDSYDSCGNTGHEHHQRTQLHQEHRSRTYRGPSGSTSHPDRYDPSKSKALGCVSISKKYALGSSSRNLEIILDNIIFLAWKEFPS